MKLCRLTIVTTFSCLFVINAAQAYIGPGAAVVFLGYIFGPIIAVAVSVGLVVAWLARLVWKKNRRKCIKDLPDTDKK